MKNRSHEKGHMVGGPGEQAERGTHRALEREPDVRIPPHEAEGSWSIGERVERGRPPATGTKRTTKKKKE